MINADIDPAFIGGNVVHTEGRSLTLLLDDKVMNPHRLRLAFGTECTSCVFKISDIFLFFGVHGYGRLTIRLKLFDERVDLLKLSVTIRMLAALACFGVRLQAETHLAQQASNNLTQECLFPVMRPSGISAY